MPETQAEAAIRPGADLKAAREGRGLTVRQVAQELHVGDAMIDALERGDYAVLGEPVFVRGHLRNYARALGIPENQVLSGYEQTQNKPPPPPLITQHPTGGMNPRNREWTLRAVSGALVLVLGVAVVWWLSRATPPAATVSAAPVALVPAPAASTAVPTVAEVATAPAVEQKPAPKPEAALAPPPAKPAAPAPRATRVNRVSAGSGAANADAGTKPAAAAVDSSLTHAVFTLSSASWIEVYDAGGKRIYYDLAPAGGSLELSGTGPLQVFLGNAPGVSIQVDGTSFDVASYTRPDNTARFKLGKPGG